MRNHFGTIIQCPCLFPSFPLDHYCMDYYRFELIFIEVLTSAFWLKPSVKWIEWTEWTEWTVETLEMSRIARIKALKALGEKRQWQAALRILEASKAPEGSRNLKIL